ncbi:MAG TPA: ABC transporter substrate-binding protein, partial [Roseiflexaceae bacterium]|nr:ABC transporter substrate-binding protein [Roseiflexaceae bacterium]
EPTAAPAAPTAAPPAPTAAPAEVSPQETLVYAADLSDQISMDPAVVYEFSGIQVVGSVYQTLVTIEPGDPTIKPLLAKSWEVAEAGDGWKLTFTLDERAKFASGNPVTADDVAYSWGRVFDLNKSPAFLFTDVAGLTKESFRAVDPQTFEVTLPATTSPPVFLSILSFTIGAVVERAVVEPNAGADFGSSWLNDNSAGSGPYVLERWERNTQTVLASNPNYWGEAPQIKRVIMRNISELANLQSAIETGEADIVDGLGAEQVQALQGNPEVQIIKGNSLLLVYAGMNVKVPPLDKVEVRQAIRYAINYDEVETLLSGNGKVVQEVIPEGLFGHTGSKPFSQDIEKAKGLLAQAGVAEGTEIEFLVPAGTAPGGIEWSTLAAKIKNDVEQIGLKLNIKQVQQSELLEIYRAQQGQLVLINWGPDFPDPDGNVTPFTNAVPKTIAWRNQWEAPEIAELAKQAAIEQDQAKRAELYRQITERVQNEGPYLFLYQPVDTFGVRTNIKGFTSDPASTPNVWFWKLSKG